MARGEGSIDGFVPVDDGADYGDALRAGHMRRAVDGEYGIRWAWSVDSVRAAEEAMGELMHDGTLMKRAARGLADVVLREVYRLQGERYQRPSVVFLVGPGNNGGDALFAAARVASAGVTCTAILMTERCHEAGLAAAREAEVLIGSAPNWTDEAVGKPLREAEIVVEGVFGTGTRRPFEWESGGDDWPTRRDRGWWKAPFGGFNPGTTVIAVDTPTDEIDIADITVTIGAPKTSLMLEPERVGRIELVDIGLDLNLVGPDAVRPTPSDLAQSWPVPGPRDHKYTRGVVGLATGSDAFPGAAVLGAVAAVTAGAGMVRYVGPRRAEDAVTAAAPEVVHGTGRVQAWVVGSGIDGPAEREHESDRYDSAMAALRSEEPVVIDAGALTWFEPGVRPEGAETVITPHAGELATLLQSRDIDVDRSTIEADPVTWARRAANETGATVLLKGGVTVIASPGDGPVTIENRAPHWLATAGTGDVLAALIGVLLAAGLEPRSAAGLAAYTHGRAAHLANPDGPVRALDVARSLGRVAAELVPEQRRAYEDYRAGRFARG